MTPQDVSADTGLKPGTVRSALLRMKRDGELRKVSDRYKLPC
jgi:DNA-binding transcriptional regulator PaaX